MVAHGESVVILQCATSPINLNNKAHNVLMLTGKYDKIKIICNR